MSNLIDPGSWTGKPYNTVTATPEQRREMALHLLAQEAYAKAAYPTEWLAWLKLFGKNEQRKAARQFYNKMCKFAK